MNWEEIFTSNNPAGGRMINVISGVAGSEASPYTADNPSGGRAINVNLIGGGSVATGVLQIQGGVPLDTTLRAVTDQANTVSPLQLSTTQVRISSAVAGNVNYTYENTDSGGFGQLWNAGNGASTYTIQWRGYNAGGAGGRIYPEGVFIGAQSAPSARLHVRGDGINPIGLFEVNSGSGVGSKFTSNSSLNLIAGSVSAPSLYWGTDATTGIYSDAANNIRFTVAGTRVISVAAANMQLLYGTTSAASPTLTINAPGNTGIYNPASGTIGFACAGVEGLSLTSTLATFAQRIIVTALPATRPATVGEFYQDTAANILANGDKVVGIRQ